MHKTSSGLKEAVGCSIFFCQSTWCLWDHFSSLSLQYVGLGFQKKVLCHRLSLRGSLFQCHPFPHIPEVSYQCLLRCRHPAVCAAANHNQSHAEQGRVGTDANNFCSEVGGISWGQVRTESS